jgi:hypothetical protein
MKAANSGSADESIFVQSVKAEDDTQKLECALGAIKSGLSQRSFQVEANPDGLRLNSFTVFND